MLTDRHNQKQAAVALFVAALAVIVIVFGAAGYGVFRYRQRTTLDARLKAELSEIQRRVASRAKDGLPPADEDVDQLLEAFRARAKGAVGEEAATYACAAEMVAAQARGGRALNQQLKALETLLVARGLDEPGDIERRLATLERFDQLNRRVLANLEAIPAAAERCLSEKRVGAKSREGFMKGIQRTPSARALSIALRRVDVDFVSAAASHLTWLKAARVRFRYDPARDALVFDRDEDVARFQESAREIEAVAQRSKEAEQALRTHLEGALAAH